mgnify:CR=1 FL=1
MLSVPEAPFEPVVEMPTGFVRIIRRKIQRFIASRFRIVDIGYKDERNWMAMVSLPDQSSKRYRCTNGIVVDEITVGD